MKKQITCIAVCICSLVFTTCDLSGVDVLPDLNDNNYKEVTFRAIDIETNAPIEGVEIQGVHYMGGGNSTNYVRVTDENGRAFLEVNTKAMLSEIRAFKTGYENYRVTYALERYRDNYTIKLTPLD